MKKKRNPKTVKVRSIYKYIIDSINMQNTCGDNGSGTITTTTVNTNEDTRTKIVTNFAIVNTRLISKLQEHVADLNKFADNTTSSVGEGIETPFTFMYDFDKIESEADYVNTYKVTAVMFNYVSLIEGTSNVYTKKLLLDDVWNYKGVFNPNPEEIDG